MKNILYGLKRNNLSSFNNEFENEIQNIYFEFHLNFISCDTKNISAITIGKFDGCHLAHQKLIGLLGTHGAIISILKVCERYLTPPIDKSIYFNIPIFNLKLDLIKHLTPIDFINLILITFPKLKKIVVGYDFCFGFQRSGNALEIQNILNQLNRADIKVEVVEKQELENQVIHSSTIKKALDIGNIKLVNKMIGRLYVIKGFCVKGQGLGKKSLFPTININNELYINPKDGVYATFTKIKDKVFKSISFLGLRLSTDNQFSIETHILDKFDKLDSDFLEISFVQRLRNNIKFQSLEALKKQIEIDIITAQEILKEFK